MLGGKRREKYACSEERAAKRTGGISILFCVNTVKQATMKDKRCMCFTLKTKTVYFTILSLCAIHFFLISLNNIAETNEEDLQHGEYRNVFLKLNLRHYCNIVLVSITLETKNNPL